MRHEHPTSIDVASAMKEMWPAAGIGFLVVLIVLALAGRALQRFLPELKSVKTGLGLGLVAGGVIFSGLLYGYFMGMALGERAIGDHEEDLRRDARAIRPSSELVDREKRFANRDDERSNR